MKKVLILMMCLAVLGCDCKKEKARQAALDQKVAELHSKYKVGDLVCIAEQKVTIIQIMDGVNSGTGYKGYVMVVKADFEKELFDGDVIRPCPVEHSTPSNETSPTTGVLPDLRY